MKYKREYTIEQKIGYYANKIQRLQDEQNRLEKDKGWLRKRLSALIDTLHKIEPSDVEYKEPTQQDWNQTVTAQIEEAKKKAQ